MGQARGRRGEGKLLKLFYTGSPIPVYAEGFDGHGGVEDEAWIYNI